MKKKLSGRPPMIEGKRIKKIDARFTEEEYKQIEKMEVALGLKKTDLVRLRLLGTSAAVLINSKELIRKLDEIGTELGRAGNNINQLAHYANLMKLKGVRSPVVINYLEDLLEKYGRRQEDLESAMRRIIKAIGR